MVSMPVLPGKKQPIPTLTVGFAFLSGHRLVSIAASKFLLSSLCAAPYAQIGPTEVNPRKVMS